jgi:adenosine deaminase
MLDIIRRMPKAELHRHLAGCMTPRILLEVAAKFNVPMPAVTIEKLHSLVVVDKPMKSLQQVLDCFALFAQTFVSTEVVRHVTRRVLEDAAADNVRYLELRFSPGFMSYNHGLDMAAVMEAVVETVGEMSERLDMVVPLIAIASREMGPDVCRCTFELAAGYRPAVVGVDLAGDEDNHPPSAFKEAFHLAYDHGLKATVHAGEQANPENVRTAVEELHAARIGHGIRIVSEPGIMELLRRRDIPLEISITSNYIVGAVPSPEEHPVGELMEAGVPCTINSDDPALFGISLSHELDLYRRMLGRSLGQLVAEQERTVGYGFASEIDKGIFRQQLHEWWSRV